MRRKKNVKITHYAPDVTVSAVDYVIPVSFDERFEKAKREITGFLATTNPDEYCYFYFDRYIKEEEKQLISDLTLQKAQHEDANKSISDKHGAELVRLREAIAKVEQEITYIDEELAELQTLYKDHNT